MTYSILLVKQMTETSLPAEKYKLKNKSLTIIVCQDIKADRAAGDSVEIFSVSLQFVQ